VKLHLDEYVASSSPVQPDAPGVSVERKLVKSDLERILDLLSHLTRDHAPQPPIFTTTSTLYSDELCIFAFNLGEGRTQRLPNPSQALPQPLFPNSRSSWRGPPLSRRSLATSTNLSASRTTLTAPFSENVMA